MNILRKLRTAPCSPSRARKARPLLEGLEDRLLLYSTLGAQWVYGSRITYSFVPDGTSVGGTPSVLFQTFNAKFPTSTWQQQFQKAASVWQAVANINLAQVTDNGTAIGANGNQQDDPRFGDIRISAIAQSSGNLAVCFLPPPINGGSDAGDIVFNSSINWQINSSYDIETVAIHEMGHALGMGHSQITYACMYAYYNGIKQTLSGDDASGLQSIYGAPQYDQFNSNGQSNGNYTKAANINSYIDSRGQIAIPSLDITTGSQVEWFSVTVPMSMTGTMVVTEQSSNLSSLSPRITVYTTSLGLLGTATSTAYGDTVSVTIPGVQPGQSYLIRAAGNSSGSSTGGFGLELNFGSQTQAPIPPPNTVVLQQPDRGGGSTNQPSRLIILGNLMDWGEALTTSDLPPFSVSPVQSQNGTPASPGIRLGPEAFEVVVPLTQMQASSASPSQWAGPVATAPPLDAGTGLIVCQALDDVLDSWRPAGILSLFGA
jgi:hypothetical protein